VSAPGPRAEPAAFLEGELRQALQDAALRVLQLGPVTGGCIHHAARVATTRGDWFAKWNHDCAPDIFLGEAEGLRALREAASDLAIPDVLVALAPAGARPACIVMEWLEPKARASGGEAALGRGLATIHARPRDAFGFPVTTHCGATPQDNRASPSWAEFYAERRLRPLARRLEKEGRIGPEERRVLFRLSERLGSLLAHDARPALIHGDLWSGNVLATTRGPALVDPASAACDREMEFGITTLFGGFSERFFAGYHEALPLPAGWRERNPLYQLYHLLNHHLIFGGHYGSEALSLARRYA
jgi:protein-ribulosamine 3-kinase